MLVNVYVTAFLVFVTMFVTTAVQVDTGLEYRVKVAGFGVTMTPAPDVTVTLLYRVCGGREGLRLA